MSLRFNFAKFHDRIALRSVEFQGVKSYRGKDSVLSPVTFQWTSGVQCLTKLALGTIWENSFCLEERALYDAMSKPQRWYQDLFGKTRICYLNAGITRLSAHPCKLYLEGRGDVEREQIPWLWKEVFGEMLHIREYLSHDRSTFFENGRTSAPNQSNPVIINSGLNRIEFALNNLNNALANEAARVDMTRISSGVFGPLTSGLLLRHVNDTLMRMALLRSVESISDTRIPTYGATLVDGQALFNVGCYTFAASLLRSADDSSQFCFKILSATDQLNIQHLVDLNVPGLWVSRLKLDFPASLGGVITHLGTYLVSYLAAGLEYISCWLYSSIAKLNGSGVEDAYEILRSHLVSKGLSHEVLKGFSLFLHQNGKARYLLDQERTNSIRVSLDNTNSASLTEQSIITPSTESLSWYATSYLRSEETMSFSDAIIPWRSWQGSPDSWKKPIPGFGASEVAVYGYGTSYAEPVALPIDRDERALCAVFTSKYADLLSRSFLSLPTNVQSTLGNALQTVTFLPADDIDNPSGKC